MRIEIKNNIYAKLDNGNLRGFTLSTNSNDIILKRGEDYEIITIIIEDVYILKVGDTIKVNDINYKINKIRQDDRNIFYLIQERATKTSQFIMPILGYNYEYFDFKETFYNSYISSNYHSIYLVYKFSSSQEYLQLEERLQKHPKFVSIIDPDPSIVVFEFELDENYWKDIDNIIEGRYSNISPTLKTKICLFHKFDVNSKTFKVLYRVKTLRQEMNNIYNFDIPSDIDLMSKPIIENELWNLENTLAQIGTKSLNPM